MWVEAAGGVEGVISAVTVGAPGGVASVNSVPTCQGVQETRQRSNGKMGHLNCLDWMNGIFITTTLVESYGPMPLVWRAGIIPQLTNSGPHLPAPLRWCISVLGGEPCALQPGLSTPAQQKTHTDSWVVGFLFTPPAPVAVAFIWVILGIVRTAAGVASR